MEGVAWTHYWTCGCNIQRLRLAWTRCDKCGATCPPPMGDDPWPEEDADDAETGQGEAS